MLARDARVPIGMRYPVILGVAVVVGMPRDALKEVAPSRGVTLLIHDVRTADDLSAAFDAEIREGAQRGLTWADGVGSGSRPWDAGRLGRCVA